MRKEVRTFLEGTEIRVKKNSRKISGYGIVFDVESKDLGGFTEIIRRSTIENNMGLLEEKNLISAFNHNFDKVMGRVGAGTLTFSVDERGVKYHFEAPNTTYGNDLLESVRRGDIHGSSFIFSTREEDSVWTRREDGTILREVIDFRGLYEMGAVTMPAYEQTTSQNRNEDIIPDEILAEIEGAANPKVEETPPVNAEADDKMDGRVAFDAVAHDLKMKQANLN